jgi:hypothetical protein
MALSIPVTETKEFKHAPVGNHIGRLFQIIDLGNQEFQGKVSHKIYLGFELPEEQLDNGKPMTVGKEVTLSLSEFKGKKSGLRVIAEGLIGRELTNADLEDLRTDIFKLLGKVGMVNVLHKTSAAGKLRAEPSAVTPLPKSIKTPPPAINIPLRFSLDEPFNQEAFDQIPSFLQNKIKPQLDIVPETKTGDHGLEDL